MFAVVIWLFGWFVSCVGGCCWFVGLLRVCAVCVLFSVLLICYACWLFDSVAYGSWCSLHVLICLCCCCLCIDLVFA